MPTAHSSSAPALHPHASAIAKAADRRSGSQSSRKALDTHMPPSSGVVHRTSPTTHAYSSPAAARAPPAPPPPRPWPPICRIRRIFRPRTPMRHASKTHRTTWAPWTSPPPAAPTPRRSPCSMTSSTCGSPTSVRLHWHTGGPPQPRPPSPLQRHFHIWTRLQRRRRHRPPSEMFQHSRHALTRRQRPPAARHDPVQTHRLLARRRARPPQHCTPQRKGPFLAGVHRQHPAPQHHAKYTCPHRCQHPNNDIYHPRPTT